MDKWMDQRMDGPTYGQSCGSRMKMIWMTQKIRTKSSENKKQDDRDKENRKIMMWDKWQEMIKENEK